MKCDKWIACLESTVLAFLLSFAGAMCLPTAFDLTADPVVLAVFCGSYAVAASLCFTWKLGLLPLAAMTFAAGYLWQEGSLALSVEGLLSQISYNYDQGYGLGMLYWSDTPPLDAEVTMALCAIGCMIALVTAWTVCRKKGAALAVITALLPLVACLVVTDRVPEETYLLLLLLGVTVLLLSQTVRRKNVRQGNALTAIVALPVLLALLLLFWAIPQDTYAGQARAEKLLLQAQSFLQNVTGQGGTGASVQTVDLSNTGQLLQLHTPVMRITAVEGDTLYLREQAYDTYTGFQWRSTQGMDLQPMMNYSRMRSASYVDIYTYEVCDMLYVPYFTKDAALGAMTENKGGWQTYTFQRYALPVDHRQESRQDTWLVEMPELRSSIQDWAEDHVPLQEDWWQTMTTAEKAEYIADYVRSSASYSRNTARMPSGTTDFARWFLEESDTGYCVHFATATAVLLRAAGIPAQYVTGYVATVEAGEPTVVYQDQAHAWVEYFIPNMGWVVLESTPAEGVPAVTDLPDTQRQPLPSTPMQTLPPEQPTAPQDTQTEEEKPALWGVLYWACGLVIGLLVLLGQWQLRVQLREKKLHTGSTNARAIACWQEIVRLTRLLRERPEPGLYTIAQKAKFSQHALEESELAPLDTCIRQSRRKLKRKPWYAQLVYKFILAVY